MIRTKKRLTLCLILILLNIIFIWGNSLLTRDISSALSKLVGQFLSMFVSGPLTPAEGEGHGILRKIAHFTEFCALGTLLGWLVRMVRSRKWEYYVIPAVAGLAVACIDETIQIFVPGRGPGLLDVVIDCSGVLMGILIITLIAVRKKRPKSKKIK